MQLVETLVMRIDTCQIVLNNYRDRELMVRIDLNGTNEGRDGYLLFTGQEAAMLARMLAAYFNLIKV